MAAVDVVRWAREQTPACDVPIENVMGLPEKFPEVADFVTRTFGLHSWIMDCAVLGAAHREGWYATSWPVVVPMEEVPPYPPGLRWNDVLERCATARGCAIGANRRVHSR